MLQHVHTISLATAGLVVLGTIHTLSAASAQPPAEKAMMRTEPERLSSAAVSSLTSASLRSISIGF